MGPSLGRVADRNLFLALGFSSSNLRSGSSRAWPAGVHGRDQEENFELRFDWFGFTALAIGIGSLQIALDPANNWAGPNPTKSSRVPSSRSSASIISSRHSLTTSKPFHPVRAVQGQNFIGGCVFMAVMGLVLFSTMACIALSAERDRLSDHYRRPAAGEPRLRHLCRHDDGRPPDAIYRSAHADHRGLSTTCLSLFYMTAGPIRPALPKS